MIANIEINGADYRFDLKKALDISMPLSTDENRASAWYVPPVKIEPVKGDGFVGDVNQGGSVNFNNIFFNPHGNGTHTECVGHISKDHDSINQNLREFFFTAQVVSIEPERIGEDLVITLDLMKEVFTEKAEAIVIRTLPNDSKKVNRQYSNSNPPYIDKEVMPYLLEMGVNHLLIDLPSVDREVDEGVLASHHVFWNYPENPNLERTITEFIYVSNEIEDGFYLLNLQIAPFENDASPSKPVLFKPL